MRFFVGVNLAMPYFPQEIRPDKKWVCWGKRVYELSHAKALCLGCGGGAVGGVPWNSHEKTTIGIFADQGPGKTSHKNVKTGWVQRPYQLSLCETNETGCVDSLPVGDNSFPLGGVPIFCWDTSQLAECRCGDPPFRILSPFTSQDVLHF